MSADAGPSPLSKVDSAVQGLSSSPAKDKEPAKRRASSSVPGVFRIEDLGTYLLLGAGGLYLLSASFPSTSANTDSFGGIEAEGKELQIAKETQKLNWYDTALPRIYQIARYLDDFCLGRTQLI